MHGNAVSDIAWVTATTQSEHGASSGNHLAITSADLLIGRNAPNGAHAERRVDEQEGGERCAHETSGRAHRARDIRPAGRGR